MVEVQEYGRGSYASSLVLIKMWLQQHDTKLHKLNAYTCTCFLVLNMMCKMPKCSLKIIYFEEEIMIFPYDVCQSPL